MVVSVMNVFKNIQKGKSFEKAIAYIQSLMDAESDVSVNEKIRDRLGHSREFDVVIRGTCGL